MTGGRSSGVQRKTERWDFPGRAPDGGHGNDVRWISQESGVMRRIPHGATTRPPLARPGSGYGRPVKLGPSKQLRAYATRSRARVRDFGMLLAVSLDES